MKIQFYIIYTPGSIRQLSPFIWSLLDHSDFSFKLVSNGCLASERRYLQRLCQQDPRLSYLTIPVRHMLPHGLILNYLQAITMDDYFCFMDSDIFARENFQSLCSSLLNSNTVIFSGMPIWVKREEEILPNSFMEMLGTFNRTDTDIVIGSTYIAMYPNHLLNKVMQETAIGFEEYNWKDLPNTIQQKLIDLGAVKKRYDTAKVLNLLLCQEKAKLINVETPSLIHIGGTSFEVETEQKQKSLKALILNVFLSTPLKSLIERKTNSRAIANYRVRYQDSPKEEFLFNQVQRLSHRTPTRRYFLRLIDALLSNKPIPVLPEIVDHEIYTNTQEASNALIRLFKLYQVRINKLTDNSNEI